MSALEEYRKWCGKHFRESVGFDLADAAIVELEAKAEHDEDNLEGLQHALVRANQRYTQAKAENKRLLDRITQLRQYRDQMLDLTHRAVRAEAERDKWADSFKQAEAALEGFLGPDGLSPYERERDAALAERDKWEWVARDACRELAYETHVNPQSPLDYRLAQWRTKETT